VSRSGVLQSANAGSGGSDGDLSGGPTGDGIVCKGPIYQV